MSMRDDPADFTVFPYPASLPLLGRALFSCAAWLLVFSPV
jgi:hypothetical protein